VRGAGREVRHRRFLRAVGKQRLFNQGDRACINFVDEVFVGGLVPLNRRKILHLTRAHRIRRRHTRIDQGFIYSFGTTFGANSRMTPHSNAIRSGDSRDIAPQVRHISQRPAEMCRFRFSTRVKWYVGMSVLDRSGYFSARPF
jgi:hypothetical protein